MADSSATPGVASPPPASFPPGMPGIPPIPVVDCLAYWRAGAREVRVFRGHHDPVWVVAYHPDGTMAASGSVDHTIRGWEVGSGRMRRSLRGHSDTGRRAAVCPDGRMLASAFTGRAVRR